MRVYFFISIFILFTSFVVYANNPINLTITKNIHQSKNATKKVITQNDLQTYAIQNISQAIQTKLSSNVIDLYGDGSNITISLRGFGENANSNSLLLINNQPLLSIDNLLSLQLNFIPIPDIKAIEISPSSDSVLYGDQAVGGTINIITNSPKKSEHNLSLDYGSFDTKKLSINLTNVLPSNLGYSIGTFDSLTNNYRDHNKNQTGAFNATFNWQNTSSSFVLRYWHSNTYFELPGSVTEQQAQEDPRQAQSNIPRDFQNFDFLQFSASKLINNNWEIHINSSFNKKSTSGLLQLNNNSVSFQEEKQMFYLVPQLNGLFTIDNHPIFSILGMEISQGNYAIDYYFNPTSDNRTEGAVYAQMESRVGKSNFHLTLGAREAYAKYQLPNIIDQPNNTATATNTKLSYELKNLAVFLKHSLAYRFPKVDEQTWTVDGKPLKTQTSSSFESGLNINYFKNDIISEIYLLNTSNEITNIPDPNSAYFLSTNENFPRTIRKGFLIDDTIQVTNNWKIDADINILDARFAEGILQNKKIPFVANETFGLSTSYTLGNFTFFVEGAFIGKRYAINDVANITDPLSAFTTYNAGFNYHYKSVIFSLRANNITNQRYNTYTVVTYPNGVPTKNYYPAAGFNVMVTLTIT